MSSKIAELIGKLKSIADSYVEKERECKAHPQDSAVRISFLETKVSMQELKIEILKENLKNDAISSGRTTLELDF
ncbi:MAG: hypothetical protein HQ596_00330 [Candidatus Saganbacteria bacterium]|nr:hypothetical protein [Candidatus Saganbacteria bacterium]